MPPRDIWDCNIVYQQEFYQSYCEFLASHDELDMYPTYLMTDQDAEKIEGYTSEEDEYFETDDDFEHESIPDTDSDDEVETAESIASTALMMLYDDICNAIGDPRLGSRYLPIDLTDD